MVSTDRGSTLTQVKRALSFFVIHVAIWTGLVLAVPGPDRVDYDLLGDGSTPWVRQFVIALLVVLTCQVVFISRFSMWSAVLREHVRSPRRLLWLAPFLLLVAGSAVLASDGLSDAPRNYWIGMTVTMLLVGLTEEITFRGILVVGARQKFGREVSAALASSALFGLFHLPNWLLGQELSATIRQVIVTAVLGLVFYALRRVSGTLITCIVLHAVYDWMVIQGSFS